MYQNELELSVYPKKSNLKLTVALYFLIGFMLALLAFFNFVSLCNISGTSMDNTLFDGQNVLLLNTKNVSRGDVVVFDEGDRALIKRVIALGGDKLAFVTDSSGNVAVYTCTSGETFNKLNESYIHTNPMQEEWFRTRYTKFSIGEYVLAHVEQLSQTLTLQEEFIISVPKNHLFVMGDNRFNSHDSRSIGTIERSTVYGKMILKLKKDSVLEKIFLFVYGGSTAQ